MPWERRLPPMPAGTLDEVEPVAVYDALARDLERPLSPAERDAIRWQDVEAEAPGFVVINRYRESPHPRVTFANDFSKRLDPQPGMQVVYARTIIDSDRDQVRKLSIGYSDDVSVFLNGRILYRGRSAQNFRDPAFLGIVSPENDAVYLPLKKGAQRADAGGQRARRRLGVHLPPGGTSKVVDLARRRFYVRVRLRVARRRLQSKRVVPAPCGPLVLPRGRTGRNTSGGFHEAHSLPSRGRPVCVRLRRR